MVTLYHVFCGMSRYTLTHNRTSAVTIGLLCRCMAMLSIVICGERSRGVAAYRHSYLRHKLTFALPSLLNQAGLILMMAPLGSVTI